MKKLSLEAVGLLQAAGLVAYIALVAFFINTVVDWFGPKLNNPIVPLSLLVLSALTCGLISLGYPIVLIWGKKQTIRGVKLVVYTALWLFAFLLAYFAYLAVV